MSHDSPPSSPSPESLGWPPPPQGALDGLAAHLPHALVVLDAAGRVLWANTAFSQLTGYGAWDAAGRSLTGLLRLGTRDDEPSLDLGDAVAAGRRFASTVAFHRKDGQTRWLDVHLTPVGDGAGAPASHAGILVDVTERVQTAHRLVHSEHLSAIGLLAAGVAHEIATPVQFVGDSVQFLRDAVADLTQAVTALRAVRQAVSAGAPATGAAEAAAAAEEAADLDYVLEHLPRAVEACTEGLERVSHIARSLKEFAHPQQSAMASVDLNHLIGDTLTLARNEFKYVADLATDFAALPPVTCVAGSISQVVLNLIVNAAHAVADTVHGTGRKGTIAVSTHREHDQVVITVRDSGAGIPAEILPHIFEPFFTTKAVGKGTGQGLAIAWDIVTRTHAGGIDVASTPGGGTTFHIRLPLAGPAARAAREAA